MNDNSKFEDLVRKNLNVRASDRTYNVMRQTVLDAHEQSQQKPSATRLTIARRLTMRKPMIGFAGAAVIVVAIMLGMYALFGSGTSITIAQVRQAMQDIDWVRIINEGDKKGDGQLETDWYSFASKVHIFVDSEGRMRFSDFKTRKNLDWNPGSKNIYEHPIDERKELAGGVTGPFEMIDKTFRIIQAEQSSETVKQLGTYEGQKVEIWTISRDVKSGGRTLTVYIDVDRKLPIAATYDHYRTDGTIRRESNIEFKYPETGPADIYEAGAPRSAQIKRSPEQ